MTVLTTERLTLRCFHLQDVDAIYRVFGNPDVMRFSDGAKTREAVQIWLQTSIDHYETWGFGPYAVAQICHEIVIGYCGLFFVPDLGGQPEIEIGYRFISQAWGHGYATEAATAVRDYAFDTWRIKRLIALIDPSNRASIRVAEKIGMHCEKEIMLEGYTHPDHIYVIAGT
jgi:RimJ/RimL family protein N-acetyltransferase